MSKLVHLIGESNFSPFIGNGDTVLTDDFGRLIGTCKITNLTPIR